MLAGVVDPRYATAAITTGGDGSTANAPTYDAAGNVTQDANDGTNGVRRYVFDAWNRLVKVLDSTGTITLASYRYDALGRRIQVIQGGVTTDLYYDTAGRVIEERVNGTITRQYVWGLGYE